MALNAEVLEGCWFAADELPHPLSPFTQQAIAAARPLFRQMPQPVEEARH
jgi:hypothetical protein